jgi:hypothetical protein
MSQLGSPRSIVTEVIGQHGAHQQLFIGGISCASCCIQNLPANRIFSIFLFLFEFEGWETGFQFFAVCRGLWPTKEYSKGSRKPYNS